MRVHLYLEVNAYRTGHAPYMTSLQGVKPMGDDPMALLGLEGALKHYLFILLCCICTPCFSANCCETVCFDVICAGPAVLLGCPYSVSALCV
jgi:hypothetical protein